MVRWNWLGRSAGLLNSTSVDCRPVTGRQPSSDSFRATADVAGCSPYMERRLGRRAGFTLVEVALVVLIIGVLALIALPKVDLTKYRVNSAMRGAGTAILGAQRYAVSHQHDVIVLFDVAANSIRVHYDENNNQAQDGDERIRRVPFGEHIVIGQGNAPAHPLGAGPVTFTKRVGGLPALTFHRNGAASELGGVYLTSQRAINTGAHPEDSRFIEIERATGRVEWYSFRPPSWVREF